MKEQLQEIILGRLIEHVIYFDREMKVLWANDAACRSVGKSVVEIKGKHCFSIWYGRTKPCAHCPVEKSLKSGECEESSIATPDGRTWLVRATPVFDDNSALEGIVELAQDITDLKRAEKKQARADALNEVINAILDPILVFSSRGVCVFANNAFEKMFGLDPSDFIGKSFMEIPGFDLQSQEEIMKYAPMFKEAVMVGRFGPVEFPIKKRDGETMHLSGTAGAIKNEKKHTTHLVIALHDIFKRKSAEKSLEKENQVLKSTLSATVIINKEGRIVYADSAFAYMWGFESPDAALDMPGEELWQDRKLLHRAVQTAGKEGRWEGDLTARKNLGMDFKAHLTAVVNNNLDGQLWYIGYST
jgi:PAS domain S-box-containing protein